ELRARARTELEQRALGCERVPVRARRGHRVERVGDCEEPRLERDRVALQPRGIALAVPVLMVKENVGKRLARPAQRTDELGSRGRVLPDLRELIEGERPGFAEQIASNGDLADVVVETAEAEQRDPRLVPAEAARHRL